MIKYVACDVDLDLNYGDTVSRPITCTVPMVFFFHFSHFSRNYIIV